MLDSYLSLSPSPTPSTQLIHQHGPASLSPEYFLTVSLPYHHSYPCINSVSSQVDSRSAFHLGGGDFYFGA